jgi:Amidohydrolase
MTIVDIHCHTFNADDLPVKGFVGTVVGHGSSLAKVLGWTLDKVTKDMASGADEVNRLDRYLRDGPGSFEAEEETALEQVDAETEALLAELETEHPVDLDLAQLEAAAKEAPPEAVPEGEEGLVDGLRAVRRYIRWAALFAKDRLALTRTLLGLYPEVELFTPLLVDFQGLEDAPKTSIVQQLELQEKISRLGMLGHFDAQVLPFVGFDPRRADAFDLAKQGVESFGCVGVKTYPPMGFKPLGNGGTTDNNLEKLYQWCCEEHVPITAHSNPSNFAHKTYLDYSSPTNWEHVLKRWPALHLNLGHFGWGALKEGWPDAICRLMATYPGLYADIGNHDLEDLDETMTELARLCDAPATSTIRQRFMFGTDWFMVASHKDFEQFLQRVRDAHEARFPLDSERFMGGAALSFLGFDDETNKNTQRVVARYERHGATVPSWLAR